MFLGWVASFFFNKKPRQTLEQQAKIQRKVSGKIKNTADVKTFKK